MLELTVYSMRVVVLDIVNNSVQGQERICILNHKLDMYNMIWHWAAQFLNIFGLREDVPMIQIIADIYYVIEGMSIVLRKFRVA